MKLNEVLDKITKEPKLYPLDYYSNEIEVLDKKGIKEEYHNCKIYKNCNNTNMICEARLSRLLQFMLEEDRDFIIITAYKVRLTKKENIMRNRRLRDIFNELKMGVYQLVGHWKECTLKDVEYKDCPEDKLEDTIERSYMVVRPKDVPFDEFYNLAVNSMTIDNFKQNAIVLHISKGTAKNNDKGFEKGYYLVFNQGSYDKLGDKVTLGKITQAYSQHVLKMNTPFVFEGLEIPSDNGGFMMFSINNVKHIL